jgi:hypothetical protein
MSVSEFIEIISRLAAGTLFVVCSHTWFIHCFVHSNPDHTLWLAAFCYFADQAIGRRQKVFWAQG